LPRAVTASKRPHAAAGITILGMQRRASSIIGGGCAALLLVGYLIRTAFVMQENYETQRGTPTPLVGN